MPAARAEAADWPEFLYGNARTGFNAAETAITPSSAPGLRLLWQLHAGAAIATQPAVSNGLVYWGASNGYEHATSLATHADVWKDFLGTSTSCQSYGVQSSADVTSIGGAPTVIVGGGDGKVYAIRAGDGTVVWSKKLGSPPDHFVWSSPALVGSDVYVGLASLGDCPLVQGRLVDLNASTGTIRHVFRAVPNGCTGASIWSSPAIDEAAGTVYVSTGNHGSCGVPEPYADAIVELRLNDLSVVGVWQVPSSSEVTDDDFGATPTLFTAAIGGQTVPTVGAANKNGNYYALRRDGLAAGPLWTTRLSPGGGNPQSGDGSISSSAWDGTRLYAGGGGTTVGASTCAGNLRALDPATGAVIWTHCYASGPVIGAVTAAGGVTAVGEGKYIALADAATGAHVFSYSSGTPLFYGPSSISNGMLFQGDMGGTLYAFGLP